MASWGKYWEILTSRREGKLDMKGINIVLGTHGKFGEELIKSAEMIVGKMDNIESVSLFSDMSMEDFKDKVESIFSSKEGPILGLVDLFGGTPSNVFSSFIGHYDIQVVTGLNFALLVEIYLKLSTAREEVPLEKVAHECSKIIKNSATNVNDVLQE